ncbi:MAG: NAD(P)/FAD-dependent oxidoreductase [Candidatus Pacebacteria bacterium]|nr:NAD(P)/FAD-dependent oxidoreductase [Candidatus Paceibacterota bacterium]
MTDFNIDVLIIGGGPAGLMSALQASNKGVSVAIVDRNKFLGRKLKLTGKGRCNITNAETNLNTLVDAYANGKFLFSAFSQFNNIDLMNFFEKNKIKLKVERGNRVFPISDSSQDIINFFKQELSKNKVSILNEEKVEKINTENNKIISVVTSKRLIIPKNVIICTGGKSYPITGSDGNLNEEIINLGHTIIKQLPALVPLETLENTNHLKGLALKNVEVSIKEKDKKISKHFGEVMFTHFGLSGPAVLLLSRDVVLKLEKRHQLTVSIDLKPALTFEQLENRLLRDFEENKNKDIKTYAKELVPKSLINEFVHRSLQANKKINSITKEERHNIIHVLKNFDFTVSKSLPFEYAIITQGGVNLDEVDQKTMQSKLIQNLYFAGEVLNFDGKTGGYNLQAC